MGFIAGFLAPFRGFFRIVGRPSLWPFAGLPILLNLALVVTGGWAWIHWGEPWIVARIPLGDGWFASAGHWVVRLVVWAATLPLLLGLFLACASLVGAPFYDVLCARTEAEQLGVAYVPPRRLGAWRAISAGIRIELANLLVALVGGTIALIAPFAVPGFGATISLGIGWFLAGFDFISYPFDRRSLSLRQKLGVAFDHLPTTIGFGIAVYVLLLPLITLPLVAPCAVVGAALVFPGGARGGRRHPAPG